MLTRVFILSLLPVSELRGAILYGMATDLPLGAVIITALIGNAILGLASFFLFSRTYAWLLTFPLVKKHMEKKIDRFGKKISTTSKVIALTLFIGIPLPVTGAVTGAFLSSVFKFHLKTFLQGMGAGIIIAAIITTTIGAVIPW